MPNELTNKFLNKGLINRRTDKAVFIAVDLKIEIYKNKEVGVWVPINFIGKADYENQFRVGIFNNNKYEIFYYPKRKNRVKLAILTGNALLKIFERMKCEAKENFYNNQSTYRKSTSNNTFLDNSVTEVQEEIALSKEEIEKLLKEIDEF